MNKKLTGFKDKNGREICFNDLVIWETDVLLEVKKTAVGEIVSGLNGNCIMNLRFPITEKLAKTLKVFEENDWDRLKRAK